MDEVKPSQESFDVMTKPTAQVSAAEEYVEKEVQAQRQATA